MDVSADDAVHALYMCRARDRLFVVRDELDRVLHLVLGVLRQRPVGQVKTASDIVHDHIQLQEQFVGCVAEERSEEHTSELQSLMRISYAVFCLKKKKTNTKMHIQTVQARKL